MRPGASWEGCTPGHHGRGAPWGIMGGVRPRASWEECATGEGKAGSDSARAGTSLEMVRGPGR